MGDLGHTIPTHAGNPSHATPTHMFRTRVALPTSGANEENPKGEIEYATNSRDLIGKP